MVKKYHTEITKHINLIDNIYTLEFKSLGRNFKFRPGQFLHLAIDEYDGLGQWPESRCFSIQSAPGNMTLKITYAVKGRFTQRMSMELKTGIKVWLKLPYGNIFESEHNKDKSIFIAGGTGITPFLSLFKDLSFSYYSNPSLFYGVREKQFDIYSKDLGQAKKINPNLTINKYYEIIDGRPDIEAIIKSHGIEASFFISGPLGMINFYKEELIRAGVEPINIITDEWE
jgi:ferredoxin-NADP reductase